MRSVRLFMTLVGALLLISGCGAGGSGDMRSPSSSASPVAAEPATAPPASGVTIRYEGNAQVEVSLNGGAGC